jgi:hypothetical protein
VERAKPAAPEQEKGGKAVYARVSRFEGSPDQIDEPLRHAREMVLPQAKQDEGFKGLIALGDRHSGKTLGITSGRAKKMLTGCAAGRRRRLGGNDSRRGAI